MEYEWGEFTVGEEKEEEEGEEGEEEKSNTVLWILPYLCFVVIVLVAKFCRKRKLTNYVAEWNRWQFINCKTCFEPMHLDAAVAMV